MKKHLIVIGIAVLLLIVGLSGCIGDEATAKSKGEEYLKEDFDSLRLYFAIMEEETTVNQYGKDAWKVTVSGELWQDWEYVSSFSESCYVKKENGEWRVSDTKIPAEQISDSSEDSNGWNNDFFLGLSTNCCITMFIVWIVICVIFFLLIRRG